MSESFDKRELRNVLGAFVTGVTVVTTVDARGQPQGVTANSFSSVSLEPPLVLWSQALAARSYPAFRDGDRFVVNILAQDQVSVSRQFASSIDDKFAGVAWTPGLGGVPVIDGSSAYLECRRVATYPGGDHVVFLGQVENFQRNAARRPLAFGGGRYMVAYAHELGDETGDTETGNGGARQTQSEVLRVAHAMLPEIAREIGRPVGLSVWGNRGPVTIKWESAEPADDLHLLVGTAVSIFNSATGRAFAAFLPRNVTEPIMSAEIASARAAGSRVPMAEDIDALISETRQHGVARRVLEHQPPEHADIDAFSAPVYDRAGSMVMALTVVARVGEVGPDWDGPLPSKLVAMAGRLSAKLGYRA